MADLHALVVACGTWPSPEVVQELAKQADHVVACDGALAVCEEYGLQADVLLGDMDSIKPEQRVAFMENGGTVIDRPAQDANDLSKALAYLEGLSVEACSVLGATGGDPQHEWANLLSCAASSLHITCIGTDHVFHFLNQGVNHSIEIGKGYEFSLFALPTANEIHLSGASFQLKGERLDMGSRGLHNVAVEHAIDLFFGEGRLMLMKPVTTQMAEGTSEA